MAARPEISITVPQTPSPANKTEDENEAALSEMAGLFVLWLAQGCGEMPDKSLGRSIAPRGSSRSNCQVKAILHGGIETGAEMRRKAQREQNERGGGSGTRGFLL